MFNKVSEITQKIKKTKPLVLNITNDVTMDFIANGLLSVGASPVMSKAEQEIEDLLTLAHAVVINLGTLDEAFIARCSYVCSIAHQLKKPIILDPVGAGATRYRTDACLKLIERHKISIIRGNASEITALAGSSSSTKGVDSTMQSEQATANAQALSKRCDAAIVISGKTDVIIDGVQIMQCDHGSPLMPMITGTGCLLSAIVAAFHAVENHRFDAAAAATIFYGICGEAAAEKSQGPGSFKAQFLDHLHTPPHREHYAKK